MTGGPAGAGRLCLVVGPSGAGKDTLIDLAAAARPEIHVPRRIVTRPEDAGGEVIDGVSPARFAEMGAAGGFMLSWEANGLAYAIPASAAAQLAAGRPVLANVSRAVVEEARARFPGVRIVSVEAPRAVLAERLSARGRETPAEIEARLDRGERLGRPAGDDVIVVLNDGPIEAALAQLLDALQPVRA